VSVAGVRIGRCYGCHNVTDQIVISWQASNLLFHSFAMVLTDYLFSILPFRLPNHLTTYTPGESPFSTNESVFWALVVYLVTIFGIQEYQKNRPPLKLTTFFQAHNIILTAGSGILLFFLMEASLPILWKQGLFYSLCDEGAWSPVRMLFVMSLFISSFSRAETGILLHD